MKAKPCAFEFWRNYVPNAPDLTYDVSNFEPTVIDLGRIIMQGSGTNDGHSPDPAVLEKLEIQRGWRHAMQITSPPTKGRASLNQFGDELTYWPRSGLRGQDCLNYTLSNGTQKSAVGRIFFNLSNRYLWKLDITRMRVDKTLHDIKLVPDHEPTMPPILYLELFWYYTHYVSRRDAQGVSRIFLDRELAFKTEADYTAFNMGQTFAPAILEQRDEVSFATDFDTYIGSGFDGWTAVPYSPKGTQGDIEIEFRAYTETRDNNGVQQVDLARPISLTYRLSDILGIEWWDSGNIQLGY